MRYCIYGRGGLGDTLRGYYWSGSEVDKDTFFDGWQYLKPLKNRYPKAVIRYIAFTANPHTANIYKFHPHINQVIQGPWLDPRRPRHNIQKYIKLCTKGGFRLLYKDSIIKSLKPARQKRFYFNPRDKLQISRIMNRNEYVVIHPFSGEPGRMVMPIKQYIPVVKRVIKKGLTPVIIGGSYIKTLHNAEKMNENFNCDIKGVINLVNKINPRVAIGLILNAKCTIGVRSFSFSVSKSGLTKSILLVSSPNNNHRTYFTPHQTIGNIKTMGWEDNVIESNIRVIGVDNSNYPWVNNMIMRCLNDLIG